MYSMLRAMLPKNLKISYIGHLSTIRLAIEERNKKVIVISGHLTAAYIHQRI